MNRSSMNQSAMEITVWDGDTYPPPIDEAPPLSGEVPPPNFNDSAPNYDEEGCARDEFHCEQLARDFMESESPIRHDVFPDSDDEREHSKSREEFMGRGNGLLYKGQTFFNGVAFKEAVVDYALHSGYNIKQYRYDRDKIGYKCVGLGENGGCSWQVYASSLPKDPMWRIRVYKLEHKCIPNGQCELFKVPVIARIFVDKIRDDPDYYMPQKIEEVIKEKWKISVTRPQCQAARNKCLKWIEAEYDEQFARLRDYAAEILDSNKNSVVEVDTIENEAGEDVFNRFYVCFDVLRKTWKESCRPLIGVDGCFLKAKLKGQLLVAIGRDADNAIYPIAWGVVQVENTDNWRWFINHLKNDLGLGEEGDGYVMVSDRQKGLLKAVELELPKIEHRKCVRHIYGNLKKNHPYKAQLKPLLWSLAWSYNETQYKQRLDRILSYDTKLYEDVLKAKPETWCRTFYKLGSFCEDVENNFTESFNKTINKAREKPLVAMLEMVRRLAMVRIAKRSAISHSHTGRCTPYVSRVLAKEHELAAKCKVSRSTNGMYEVELSDNTYRVSLSRYTCTCMKYQISGIPCEHAYGAIIANQFTVEEFVCHWFRTATWRKNYVEGIVPQRGAAFWPASNGNSVQPPQQDQEEPTRKKNKINKADKKRKRGVHESPTKKSKKSKKRVMHCGLCGSEEHNCRFHKKKGTQASEVSLTQESQVLDG